MEAVDKDVLSQISLDEVLPVEQTLNTKPERFLSSYIKFGNSGFRMRVDKGGKNNFDYTPENNSLAVKDKGGKYALMLSASLLELHTLLNSQEKITELGFENSNLDEMSAFTNIVFVNALEKLFLKSDVKDIARDEGDGVVIIDLHKFKSLDDSDPLLKYLTKVSKMSKGMKVTYFESSKKQI